MGEDSRHPLRLRFDGFVADFIARLKEDPALRLKGEAIKDFAFPDPAAWRTSSSGSRRGWASSRRSC